MAATPNPPVVFAINESNMTAACWDFLKRRLDTFRLSRDEVIAKLQGIIGRRVCLRSALGTRSRIGSRIGNGMGSGIRRTPEMAKPGRFMHWVPRILAIAFIIFLSLFSLDVISSELSFLQVLVGLLIHSIPSMIILVVLLVAWRDEVAGGIAFLLAGLLYVAIAIAGSSDVLAALSQCLIIAGPPFLIGALFLFNGLRKRRD